ncbi:hypothetical protein ACJMK2_026033 [Sinanodonta woodiana]|uniref:Uncharacterized protein n=1 Tax=Sinanodonta woodiana TaxID=1069815 RepID=A0ABD3XIB8_SINWO
MDFFESKKATINLNSKTLSFYDGQTKIWLTRTVAKIVVPAQSECEIPVKIQNCPKDNILLQPLWHVPSATQLPIFAKQIYSFIRIKSSRNMPHNLDILKLNCTLCSIIVFKRCMQKLITYTLYSLYIPFVVEHPSIPHRKGACILSHVFLPWFSLH